MPGEIIAAPGDIEVNVGRSTLRINVADTGDRPTNAIAVVARCASRFDLRNGMRERPPFGCGRYPSF